MMVIRARLLLALLFDPRLHPEPRRGPLVDLEHLWNRRGRLEPVLVVIDEAHNVCAAVPPTFCGHATREGGADVPAAWAVAVA
jgi:hypothetical protein